MTANADTQIMALPFVKGLGNGAVEMPSSIRQEVHNKLAGLAQRADRQQQKAAIYAFIEQHWQPWTGPVSEEHRAMQTWQLMIKAALEEAAQNYKRDYLDHPEKNDSFQRTLVQLLMLLEIPAIAAPLVKMRSIITWPARKLFDYGKSYTSSNNKSVEENAITMEQFVLSNSCDHVLITLINKLDKQEAIAESLGHWWKLMREQLHSQREQIKAEFEENIIVYQDEFQVEVEQAAQELYSKLEKQPATLNSLRAARTTADAAGLALAVQAGCLGLHDLFLAPLMLSITSMLTESALGNYLKTVKARLRVQQMEAADNRLYRGFLNTTLTSLLKTGDHGEIILISEKALSDATEMLRAKRA